jgi:DNA-directed RNA polymerase specialized sigma24 family protein
MAGFQDIYKRYAQDVYRFALCLFSNRALAEDITSEAFVPAYVLRMKGRFVCLP